MGATDSSYITEMYFLSSQIAGSLPPSQQTVRLGCTPRASQAAHSLCQTRSLRPGSSCVHCDTWEAPRSRPKAQWDSSHQTDTHTSCCIQRANPSPRSDMAAPLPRRPFCVPALKQPESAIALCRSFSFRKTFNLESLYNAQLCHSYGFLLQ